MAKAKYHKSQRVFVKPVGTWAYVEAVVPKWINGCEEPIKITYDCGMGREFAQEELEEESAALQTTAVNGLGGAWRVVRGHNRWKSAEQCGHHPHPGTHPMVVTTERDWGGWRVPGAPNTISIPIVSSVRPRSSCAPDFHEAPGGVRRICRPGAGKSERGSDQARADRPPHHQRSFPVAANIGAWQRALRSLRATAEG
jgi:hypothetical protein